MNTVCKIVIYTTGCALMLFLILFVVRYYTVEKELNACLTPSREPGMCVPIDQCSIGKDIPKNVSHPLFNDLSRYLEKNKCGNRNETIFVCCAPRDFNHNGYKEATAPENHSALNFVNSQKCGRSTEDRVRNGDDTAPAEFPWVVRLGYNNSNVCTGSLINKRYVLTAAHCINPALKFVLLGQHDANKMMTCDGDEDEYEDDYENDLCWKVQNITIDETIVHQQYKGIKFPNDIALIRLKDDADISEDNVGTICLPTTPELQAKKLDQVVVAGWGFIRTDTPTTILQKAIIPVVANKVCEAAYYKLNLTSTQMCAGGFNGTVTCPGDSGGPVFDVVQKIPGVSKTPRYVQYGVVSAGFKCDGKSIPAGVHTLVAPHMKWILDNLASRS